MPASAARLGVLAAVAALYVAAGKLGLQLAVVHASATAVWPPAGIALAAVLLLGRQAWPAIFVGALVVNATSAASLSTSLGIAVGNTLEAVLGAALVERLAGGPAALERTRGVFGFAFAVLVSATVAAAVGVTSLALTGSAAPPAYPSIWLTWWLGDATGALVVAPAILAWARDRTVAALVRRSPEALALLGATGLTALLVFGGVLPPGLRNLRIAYVCLPPLLWAALRFGPREAATLVAGLGAAAVVGTHLGYGPFAVASPNESLLLLQAFMGTVAVTALAVAALMGERQRAEAAIRAGDEQLRLAVDAGGMGTWQWDVETGAVGWSTRLEAIHGLGPGTFPGTLEAFKADVHPADRAVLETAIAKALQTGEHQVEYRIVRPDGTIRWVEGRGRTYRGLAGQPVRMVGVCTDVTERRREQERAAFLGEIARSITSSLDLDTVLRRIAEGAQALCGSDTAAMFLPDGDSDAMVGRYRVGPPQAAYREVRILPGQGVGGQAMLARRPVRTADYLADPAVPDHFRAVARETGTVALMVVPILVGEEVAGLLYISNRTARAFTDEDETVCVRLAEQAAVAIQNARLFSQQDAARAAAEAANRAKDEFLAMLGHEFRNPLAALASAARVLTLVDPAHPQAAAAHEVVDRQVRHLTRLVDDLLDVSRVMSGKIALRSQRLDLGTVARRAVDVLEAAGRLARHVVRVETAPAWVDGDPTRLEQVVTNLVENAAKYTPEAGAIVVATGTEGDRAVLTVRDTGAGIPADLLPRIFSLFVQGDRSLDRRAGGLGIGLTLVRRLIELHDGTVTAASEGAGRGSTFTVRLPAVVRAAGSATPDTMTPAPVSARVLVVEDNDDAREMLCQLLRLRGHDVHEAADGASAVERALMLKPDLVLVDIGLPGMDGYELARRLRDDPRGQSLRLVALTGYGRPEDRERSLAAGFDHHLVKPLDPAAIDRLLA